MSKEKGDIAEKKAIFFLEKSNFEIVEKNFYAKKLGEIDIIAQRNKIYHFIEVKSANDYETAINNITSQKLSKIKRSVDFYIQKNNLNISYSIDVIIVVDDKIELLENITM